MGSGPHARTRGRIHHVNVLRRGSQPGGVDSDPAWRQVMNANSRRIVLFLGGLQSHSLATQDDHGAARGLAGIPLANMAVGERRLSHGE